MRGKALLWINSDLLGYINREVTKETIKWIEDYASFKKRIRQVFGPANEELVAKGVI